VLWLIAGGGKLDMQAVYLQSVRSPRHQGALMQRIARYRERRHSARWNNVYSQPVKSDDDDDDDDDDYIEDSFCVDGSDTQGELVRLCCPIPDTLGAGYCFRSISLFIHICIYFFLSLFLCQRDYEKMAGPICMKFSGKVWSDHWMT